MLCSRNPLRDRLIGSFQKKYLATDTQLNLEFSATLFQCLSLQMLAFAILISLNFSQNQAEICRTFHYHTKKVFTASVGAFQSRYIIEEKRLYR